MSIEALADEARRRAKSASLDVCFPGAKLFDPAATTDANSLSEAIEELVMLAGADDERHNRRHGPGSRFFDCYDYRVVTIRDFVRPPPRVPPAQPADAPARRDQS